MLALINDTGILIAVILFVALFGASQIPKLARNLGEAGREFRKAHAEGDSPEQPAPVFSASASSDDRITLTPAQLATLTARPAAPAQDRT